MPDDSPPISVPNVPSEPAAIGPSWWSKFGAWGTYWLTLYFILVGTAYLWGYWGTLGINILEYLSPTDVIKLAAYRVATSLAGAGMGLVIVDAVRASFTTDSRGREIRSTGNAGGTAEEMPVLLSRILWVTERLFQPTMLFAAGLFIVGSWSGPHWKQWSVPLCGYWISARLRSHPVLKAVFPTLAPRLVFWATFAPFACYSWGAVAAFEALEGKGVAFVAADQLPIDNRALQGVRASRYKVLGQAGDYVFLLGDNNGSVVILPFSKLDGLAMSYSGAR